jgi:hypothetical protein
LLEHAEQGLHQKLEVVVAKAGLLGETSASAASAQQGSLD